MPTGDEVILRVKLDMSQADKELRRFFDQTGERELTLGGEPSLASPGRSSTSQIAKSNQRQVDELRRQTKVMDTGFKQLGAAFVSQAVGGAVRGGLRGGAFGAITGGLKGAGLAVSILAAHPAIRALGMAGVLAAEGAEAVKERAETAMDQAAAFDPRAALARARFNIAQFQAARARAQVNAPFAVRAFEERRAWEIDPRRIGLQTAIDRDAMRSYAGAISAYRDSDAPDKALASFLKLEEGAVKVVGALERFRNELDAVNNEKVEEVLGTGVTDKGGQIISKIGSARRLGGTVSEVIGDALERRGDALEKSIGEAEGLGHIWTPMKFVSAGIAKIGSTVLQAQQAQIEETDKWYAQPTGERYQSGYFNDIAQGASIAARGARDFGRSVWRRFFETDDRGMNREREDLGPVSSAIGLPSPVRDAIRESYRQIERGRPVAAPGGLPSLGDPLPA